MTCRNLDDARVLQAFRGTLPPAKAFEGFARDNPALLCEFAD